MRIVFVGVAAVYAALVGGLYVFQREFLYQPDRSRPTLGAAAAAGFREVTIVTQDGLGLLAWHLAPPNPDRPVIVYFHGNGGHIGYRTDRAVKLAAAGYGALLLGYRGYGANPGQPSEDGIFADARAALAWLRNQGVASRRVVLYGESLGTAVAVRMAAESNGDTPVGAVILESPFTSIADVAQHHYPFVPARWLLKDRFEATSYAAALGAPLLVLLAEDDDVVPAKFARAFHAAASEPKELAAFAGANHNQLWRIGGFEAIGAFLDRWMKAPPSGEGPSGEGPSGEGPSGEGKPGR